MAQKMMAKVNTPSAPSYIDFKPNSEFKQADGVHTLIIYLPGFRKEQLKVQVSSLRILKVSGEKTENGEGLTIRRRFLKEIKVPEGCNTNEIRAKFINGELHLTLPIKVITVPQAVQQQQQEAAISEAEQKPKSEAEDHKEQEQNAANQSSENGKMGSNFNYYDQLKYHTFGLRSSLARLRGCKSLLALQFGVAMVAIGAFVAHKYIHQESELM